MHAGTSDFKKPLAIDGWAHCYINYCCKQPAMYPDEFDVAARAILRQDLGMEKHEVDEDNAKLVYIHLLHIFT